MYIRRGKNSIIVFYLYTLMKWACFSEHIIIYFHKLRYIIYIITNLDFIFIFANNLFRVQGIFLINLKNQH